MSSSSPYSLFCEATHGALLLRCRTNSAFSIPQKPRFLRLSASPPQRNLELSWFSPGPNATEDYNGWAVVEAPLRSNQREKKGLSTFVVGGIGTSMAVLLATIAYFSLSAKGFKLRFGSPLNSLHQVLRTEEHKSSQIKIDDSGASDANTLVPQASPEPIPEITGETVASADKLECVGLSVAVDSTQQEALSLLKKLKIIEDDVRADELCTRREYARWLVCINSLLERNPKHKIIPSVLLSGSVTTAFDDVGTDDPDFASIQALAEAGVIPSILSKNGSGVCSSEGQGCSSFYPERYISRQDLISWKAQLEYEFVSGLTEQISRTKVFYMDVKEISPDASPELFMDMLAEDMSIIRKVFGKSRRLQSFKPSTKAQAAVALTSGRMSEAAHAELLRLEAELYSRQAEMEVIRTELLDRGDIQAFWDEKLQEVKIRGSEVENIYLAAVHELEQEKIVQEKIFAEHLKENAAMDCQRQLLLRLKEEVNEMSERLASERVIYVSEKCNLQEVLTELQTKQEGLLDTKSILEAENEALRILRSWLEDEARKSQARAKVLEAVRRRWEWDDRS
ncbi:hypothetical protein HS088_TW22G01466 [Tripterygium wilfordii]|uniref:SLH domain-containing protein n=1 Tax=Tripterygium wilfordii TaxID=458696 RepID=A0A7J7C0T2_TRIWF|nr:uncharacterized protein LOC119990398 isoform X2 [Tripterygium wilfordii]KAF5727769.1 hypothetical protein HS088_TW22G01466 [Tripterygium wilfordii]